MSDETSVSRPILVTIVGVLYLLVGLLVLIGGIVISLGVSILSEEVVNAVMGIPVIVVGLIAFLIGYGLIKGWKVMWYLGVIFSAIGVLCEIFMIVTIVGAIPGIILLLIDLLILYYLFRPGVKEFFGI